MKMGLKKLNALLKKNGYSSLHLQWHADGLLNFGKQKPDHDSGMPWEPEWVAKKNVPLKNKECYSFHLEFALSDDGGPQYWVADIQCWHHYPHPSSGRLNHRPGFRGPVLHAEIREIMEDDLGRIGEFEKILRNAVDVDK